MARRVTRPLALRVTRVVLPWGVSAHMATLAAWAVALAAVVCFAFGGVSGWLAGAILLQLWYLLDHVDGQLARYLGTESLDGAALDYLMHHSVNLLLPIGIGWGMSAGGERLWLLLGIAWGTGLLLLGLVNDVRYKAFIKRLKRLDGELRVIGGGGGRPAPPAELPRRPIAAATWLARKACETHVTMNVAGLLAVGQWLLSDGRLLIGRAYLATMGCLALVLAAGTIWRLLRNEAAEREFAAWFQPPKECDLVYDNGWWRMEHDKVTG
jgi:phosphatidylglycerophosphate synthase